MMVRILARSHAAKPAMFGGVHADVLNPDRESPRPSKL